MFYEILALFLVLSPSITMLILFFGFLIFQKRFKQFFEISIERNEQLHLIFEKLEEINNSFMFLNLRGHKSNNGEE